MKPIIQPTIIIGPVAKSQPSVLFLGFPLKETWIIKENSAILIIQVDKDVTPKNIPTIRELIPKPAKIAGIYLEI